MEKLEEDKGINYRPTRKAIQFLCLPNEVRRKGNEQAHNAESEEIKMAIEMHGPQRKDVLIELYQFTSYHTSYNSD